MNKTILYLINYLKKKNQFHFFYLLIFLSTIAAILEIVSLGSIPVLLTSLLKKNQITLFNIDFLNNLSVFEIGILVIVLFLIKNIFLIFLFYFENKFLKKVNTITKNEIYEKLIYFPNEKINNMSNSKITSLIVEAGNHYSSNAIFLLNLIRESLILSLILIYLIYSIPIYSLLLLLFFGGFVLFFYKIINKQIKTLGKIIQNLFKNQVNILNENFKSLNLLKIYKKENFFFKNFKIITEKKETSNFYFNFINRLPKVIIELLSILFLVLVILYYINLNFTSFQIIEILAIVTVSIIRFIPLINSMTTSLIFLKRVEYPTNEIIKILNTKYDDKIKILKKSKKSPKIVIGNKLSLKISKLSFSYSNSFKIFKNLNLSFKSGDFAILMGESGLGKTTLIQLFLCFLKPLKGKILFNGNEIFKNISEWYSLIGYVPQNNIILNDQIRRNIAFGCKENEIDNKRINYVLKKVELYEFIYKRKKNIFEVINPRSTNFSGGQLQRLAIARALYFKPRVLIMDEPTNSLDSNSEESIFKMLKKLNNIDIKIVVSHGTNLKKYCNKIINLNKDA